MIQWLEDDMRCAIAVWHLKSVAHAVIGAERQVLFRGRRRSDRAAPSFQTQGVQPALK